MSFDSLYYIARELEKQKEGKVLTSVKDVQPTTHTGRINIASGEDLPTKNYKEYHNERLAA